MHLSTSSCKVPSSKLTNIKHILNFIISYDDEAASVISSLQGSFDDEVNNLESQNGDLNDEGSFSSASSQDSRSNHLDFDDDDDVFDDDCSHEERSLSSNSSISSEKSQLSNHCSDAEESDDDEEEEEESDDESEGSLEEKEEVDMKLQEMIENEVNEDNGLEFDDIEYVNTIAMCGSHDDDSSVSAKEFESIMDKVQKEDTFYEVSLLFA